MSVNVPQMHQDDFMYVISQREANDLASAIFSHYKNGFKNFGPQSFQSFVRSFLTEPASGTIESIREENEQLRNACAKMGEKLGEVTIELLKAAEKNLALQKWLGLPPETPEEVSALLAEMKDKGQPIGTTPEEAKRLAKSIVEEASRATLRMP